MKLPAVVFAVFALGAAAAPAVPPSPPSPPSSVHNPAAAGHGLREALQEFFRRGPSTPSRHLSKDERAELRRQLDEYGRAPARPSLHQNTR